MLKIGDSVKIVNNDGNGSTKYIIEKMNCCVGNIGVVTDIDTDDENEFFYCVNDDYWWVRNNLEKGHLEWVKDED